MSKIWEREKVNKTLGEKIQLFKWQQHKLKYLTRLNWKRERKNWILIWSPSGYFTPKFFFRKMGLGLGGQRGWGLIKLMICKQKSPTPHFWFILLWKPRTITIFLKRNVDDIVDLDNQSIMLQDSKQLNKITSMGGISRCFGRTFSIEPLGYRETPHMLVK